MRNNSTATVLYWNTLLAFPFYTAVGKFQAADALTIDSETKKPIVIFFSFSFFNSTFLTYVMPMQHNSIVLTYVITVQYNSIVLTYVMH